jgi:hypothetical protein
VDRSGLRPVGGFRVLVIPDLLLVLPQLLLELLHRTVHAPPQVGGVLVTDHVVKMLGGGDDFDCRQPGILEVDGHIEGGEAVEIPLESRDLGGDF